LKNLNTTEGEHFKLQDGIKATGITMSEQIEKEKNQNDNAFR